MIHIRIKSNFKNALEKVSRYTKTDLFYLAKGGFWLTLGQFFTQLLTLLTAIFFANFLPSDTYGTYKFVLSIFAIFGIFTLPGLKEALNRASAIENQTAKLVNEISTLRIKSSLFGTVVALSIALYYFFNDNYELATAFTIVAIFIPFCDTLSHYVYFLYGRKNYSKAIILQLFVKTVSALSLFLTLLITDNLFYILIAFFLPLSLSRFAVYLISNKSFKFIAASPNNETLHLGKHLSAMQVVGTLSSQLDKILLWKFFGPTDLAIYAFALALPQEIKAVLKNIGILAMPKYVNQTQKQFTSGIKFKIPFFILLLIFITASYILTAPYIFKILFPQYTQSIFYSQLYSLTILFVPAVLFSNFFIAKKRIRELYISKIINPILLIGGYVTLIPIMGITGAILAMLVTNVISLILWITYLKLKS